MFILRYSTSQMSSITNEIKVQNNSSEEENEEFNDIKSELYYE